MPEELLADIDASDFVIHLGDFISLELLNDLRKTGKFFGIFGNHDIGLQAHLRRTEQITIGDKKLGLIHGLIVPIASRMRMRRLFRSGGVDAILYGHTHIPTARHDNGVFYFNPGSVAGKFPALAKSYGRLTVNGTISGEIVTLEKVKARRHLHLQTILTCHAIRTLESLF